MYLDVYEAHEEGKLPSVLSEQWMRVSQTIDPLLPQKILTQRNRLHSRAMKIGIFVALLIIAAWSVYAWKIMHRTDQSPPTSEWFMLIPAIPVMLLAVIGMMDDIKPKNIGVYEKYRASVVRLLELFGISITDKSGKMEGLELKRKIRDELVKKAAEIVALQDDIRLHASSMSPFSIEVLKDVKLKKEAFLKEMHAQALVFGLADEKWDPYFAEARLSLKLDEH